MSDSNHNTDTNKKTKKKKKTTRCEHPECRVKLKLTDWSCKCGNIYCAKHRTPENHNCTYDWTNKAALEKKIDNMKCVASKIITV